MILRRFNHNLDVSQTFLCSYDMQFETLIGMFY